MIQATMTSRSNVMPTDATKMNETTKYVSSSTRRMRSIERRTGRVAAGDAGRQKDGDGAVVGGIGKLIVASIPEVEPRFTSPPDCPPDPGPTPPTMVRCP